MQADTKVRYITTIIFALIFAGMAGVMLTIISTPDGWVLAAIVVVTGVVMLVTKTYDGVFRVKESKRV